MFLPKGRLLSVDCMLGAYANDRAPKLAIADSGFENADLGKPEIDARYKSSDRGGGWRLVSQPSVRIV